MEKQRLESGTTTVGLIAKDAVVLATEQKATMGYLIESKQAKKLYKLDNHIGMTIAGSVGDAQFLVRLLRAQLKLYKLDRGPITVNAAANLLSNILQGNKFYPYFNLLILGGYDANGPSIFSLDPVGGYVNEDKFYSTGSGSNFAYGVLEAGFKENMSTEEALSLVIKSIKAAIERDIGSGGKGFNLAVIDKNGYKEFTQQEIKKYM